MSAALAGVEITLFTSCVLRGTLDGFIVRQFADQSSAFGALLIALVINAFLDEQFLFVALRAPPSIEGIDVQLLFFALRLGE